MKTVLLCIAAWALASALTILAGEAVLRWRTGKPTPNTVERIASALERMADAEEK